MRASKTSQQWAQLWTESFHPPLNRIQDLMLNSISITYFRVYVRKNAPRRGGEPWNTFYEHVGYSRQIINGACYMTLNTHGTGILVYCVLYNLCISLITSSVYLRVYIYAMGSCQMWCTQYVAWRGAVRRSATLRVPAYADAGRRAAPVGKVAYGLPSFWLSLSVATRRTLAFA